jgi:hypothetical protein
MPVITAPAKKAARKTITKKKTGNTKPDVAAGYNQFKNYNGQQYTGMQINGCVTFLVKELYSPYQYLPGSFSYTKFGSFHK